MIALAFVLARARFSRPTIQILIITSGRCGETRDEKTSLAYAKHVQKTLCLFEFGLRELVSGAHGKRY